MNCIPVVMVRNEAFYIRQVLTALGASFSIILVADTGSTDGTAEIAEQVPGVVVTRMGVRTPQELGRVRGEVCKQGLALGYEWAFLVDGDELYHPDAVRLIADAPIPEGGRAGYTTMVSVEMDALGQVWTMADRFNRQAIFPLTDTWNGEYPFESPSVAGLGGAANFYLPLPAGLHQHALHLHRLVRSPHDGVVYRRLEKQFQYSMVPVTVPREGRLEDPWKTLLS